LNVAALMIKQLMWKHSGHVTTKTGNLLSVLTTGVITVPFEIVILLYVPMCFIVHVINKYIGQWVIQYCL